MVGMQPYWDASIERSDAFLKSSASCSVMSISKEVESSHPFNVMRYLVFSASMRLNFPKALALLAR